MTNFNNYAELTDLYASIQKDCDDEIKKLKQEFNAKVKEIKQAKSLKEEQTNKEYIESVAKYKVGDVITIDNTKVKVDKIKVTNAIDRYFIDITYICFKLDSQGLKTKEETHIRNIDLK